MDFGTLLHVAKKNSEADKNASKFYSTKFAPPKKESKDKKLSENIQKFLKKREEDEKERQRIEREKLSNLLSKRDEKSKNKIKKMLKVTKSANKSVLDDAINTEHTAVTMQGPDQPDQDDYGYVSTEANAFYQKYIEKVKDVKEDKGFAPSRPQSLKDLTGTKERVKAAITKEIEEKKNHTRQRTSTIPATSTASTTAVKESSASIGRSSSKTLYDPEEERREEERKKREEEQRKAKHRKPAPPPMDFQALLKLAEKKQHEPIEIVVEVKKKEPERLLTSKEKRELEERQREREARERRKRERNENTTKDCSKSVEQVERNKDNNSARMEPNGRIPKLNQTTKVATGSTITKPATKSASSVSSSNGFKKPNVISSPNVSSSSCSNSQAIKSSVTSSNNSKVSSKPNTASNSLTKKPTAANQQLIKSSSTLSVTNNANSNKPGTGRTMQASSSSLKTVPSGDIRDIKTIKPRQFPPTDVQKTRQFPPPDVRRGPGSKSSESRKHQMAQKRRILDDDDDEYDSELDDFIDDGDCEDDYSSHIKEIFGYDKSRYRDMDDEDDAAMESNFAQVQREEYISKKIGIKEDLEDMKMEAAEKKRKMMMKKRHH